MKVPEVGSVMKNSVALPQPEKVILIPGPVPSAHWVSQSASTSNFT
jgi:hypothetical protein